MPRGSAEAAGDGMGSRPVRRVRRTSVLSLLGVAGAVAVGLPLAATTGSGDPNLPDLVSSATGPPSTQIYRDGRLLIRFDGFVVNSVSALAPLEIQASNPDANGVMQSVQQYVGTTPVGPGPGGKPVVRYESADGHNHYHLKNAAEYSLWNLAETARMALAQKTEAGFCLEDSEQIGGNVPAAYASSTNNFCGRNQGPGSGNPPNPLIMGISPGWRDIYYKGLSYQWVDVSNVAPGRYRLASRVNPDKTIHESDYGNDGYVYLNATVPGYTPKGIDAGRVDPGRSLPITLAADKFTSTCFQNNEDFNPSLNDTPYCDPGPVQFVITSLPSRGALTLPDGTPLAVGDPVPSGGAVTYTPGPGQRGADSFGYEAQDSNMPGAQKTKPIAAVAIQVGAPVTSVAISGAPASMLAGVAVQLQAVLTNGLSGVTWSASSGSVTATGLFTAPHTPGTVTVRATSKDDPSASAAVSIRIVPAGKQAAAPTTPSNKMIAGFRVGRVGPRLLVTRVATGPRGGKLTVTATFRRRVLGRCVTRVGADRAVTCRIRLRHRYDLRKVRVTAKLTVAGGRSAVRRLFVVR